MSASDYAIRVEGLGKRYRLGLEQSGGLYRYKSLRDSLGGLAKRPIQAARGLLAREPMNETNSFWALNDVSFDVKRGEVVGIIGRNGAGKSTLLKILSKITKPTEGHIELRGRVGSLLEVGTGFHPELSGRENIYLNGAILGMTRAEVRGKFDEIVAFSEIEKFLDTPVKQYSSGMYTRLAFAVAAHLDPEILVVDEVLAVGDAAFQRKCLGKMKDVAGEGRTVLFVSHNMGAVQALCSSAVLLERGTVQLHSRAGVVASRYLAGDSLNAEWQSTDAHHGPPTVFRLTRLATVDPLTNLTKSTFSASEAISVVVEGVLEQADPGLCIGFSVFSDRGDHLFRCLSTDRRFDDWPQLKIGHNRLRADIPCHLLNEGLYLISADISLHNRSWIHDPNKTTARITFEIAGGLSDSPMWLEARPGLLAPVLRFHSASK